MPGALEGIRVIDFGQYIAGPLAAVMLSDQGADVIHVDPPGGPFWKHPSDAFYNRGKRRITLDLKSAADNRIAQQLIDSADVVVENFRPGVMDRLGLGQADMTGRNQQLIYASLPGFAADDPRAGMEAWEGILKAATDDCIPRAGEEPPGWDWSRPFYSAITHPSNFAAFLGATGIVMALIARQRTGRGQYVEAPAFDAMFTLIGHSGAFVTERGLHPPRGIHGRGAGSFRCKDGKHVQFDTSSARHLVWFAQAAGITDWGPDYLDVNRLKDEAANQRLHARLRELFLTRTAEEWEKVGYQAGMAMGWARSVPEWIDTDHARQIGAVVQLEDPELGPTWMAGVPVHLSATDGAPRGPRHKLDADRAAVLSLPARPAATYGSETIAHPLQGMKVVDMCLALAGPTCGRLLLEFGADVVKINAPKAGVGGYLNRGKRSILLDLESFDAQQVFWGLAEQADVVLENFSPGSADRLGIGYREVRARNADVVYTSISAYGNFGPWKNGRGWERQGQAVAGIMERQDPPAILGPYNLIDIGTGCLGTFATSLGLFHRVRTGQGQHVQASLCQTATYQQTPFMLAFAGHEPDDARGYMTLGTGPLNRFYQASDGKWLFLASHSGLPPVEGLDPARLEESFTSAPAAEWVRRLRQAGVPAQERVPVDELMADPYVRER
ncbi:MAG: CoA transferase, partial [Chloroflexi bacterium]|nr:CoA transferase [Chloroflexota bacterium]